MHSVGRAWVVGVAAESECVRVVCGWGEGHLGPYGERKQDAYTYMPLQQRASSHDVCAVRHHNSYPFPCFILFQLHIIPYTQAPLHNESTLLFCVKVDTSDTEVPEFTVTPLRLDALIISRKNTSPTGSHRPFPSSCHSRHITEKHRKRRERRMPSSFRFPVDHTPHPFGNRFFYNFSFVRCLPYSINCLPICRVYRPRPYPPLSSPSSQPKK